MASQQIIQNIVGGSRHSNMNVINVSHCQNMYFETQGEGASSTSILRSIQGMETILEIEGVPRGRFEASRGPDGNPRLFECFGTSVYVIDKDPDTGAVIKTVVGTVSNATTPVAMVETGGEGTAYPHMVICDGASVFACSCVEPASTISTTWRSITLPKNANSIQIKPTHAAYLYGYLLVNDSQTDGFYMSYQYPFETTTTEGEIDYDIFQTVKYEGYGWVTYAEWMPDNITAMIGTGSRVWVLGPKSYQIFQFNNDINYPFTSPDTAAAAIGILAPNSLCVIGPRTFWLGSSDIGNNGIYMGNINEVSRISNSDIEREISSMALPSDALAQVWMENSHVFYSITFITDNKTFVYDVNEQRWHDRVSTDPNKNISNAWRYKYAVQHEGKIYFSTDGALVRQSTTSWKEHDGTTMIRLRRCGAIMKDYSPITIDSLMLFINNGYTNSVLIKPKVMLRFSKDGTTFNNERLGYMGRQGQYGYVTEFPRLGMGRIWNFEISCSEDIDFTLMSAKILYTECGRF